MVHLDWIHSTVNKTHFNSIFESVCICCSTKKKWIAYLRAFSFDPLHFIFIFFFPMCDWNTVCKFENAYTHVLTQTHRCKRFKLTRFECIFYEKKQGRRLQNCWFSRACLSPHSLNRFNRSSHFEWTQFYINFLFFIDHNSIKFLKRFSISANPIACIFFICTFGWYSMWLQNGRLKQFQWHYWQFQRICFFLLFLYSRRKCLFSGLNTNCSWNVRYGVQRTEALDLNRNSRLELELKFIFHSAV